MFHWTVVTVLLFVFMDVQIEAEGRFYMIETEKENGRNGYGENDNRRVIKSGKSTSGERIVNLPGAGVGAGVGAGLRAGVKAVVVPGVGAGVGAGVGEGQPNVTENCECGAVNNILDPIFDPTLNYTGCSVTQDYHMQPKTSFRISGGSKSGGANGIKNQYPFMANIHFARVDNFVYMCGGTLISNKHILTASHCLKNVEQPNFTWTDNTYIQLGGHNINRKEEFERYFIKDYKFPPGIRWTGKKVKFDHDIAIMVLKNSVKFTKNISPICLPQPNEIIDHKLKAIAVGWGNICNIPNEQKIKSDELKHIQIELVDINILDRTIVDFKFNKLTNFLANLYPTIEGRQQRIGKGDSGGPLIQQIKDTDPRPHYKLIGATSQIIPLRNGTVGVAVYAAIIPFVSWIKQTVASEPGSFICKKIGT